jgi:hypothetical protein
MHIHPDALKELRAACEMKEIKLFVTPDHLLDLAPTAGR